VGAQEEVTIMELANQVATIANPKAKVVVRGVDSPANMSRYVPSVERIRKELGVFQTVALQQAVSRTSLWLVDTDKQN
jgi:dTDP-glucose 4,6-dehydratase